jgi:hypothetical protein
MRDKLQLCCDRLRGRNLRRIDYRHVIWSLVRKPGGFARYVYREEMFPSVVFRRAYDSIQTPHHGVKGDVEYLRILHLAASTLEADVEAALARLLAEGKAISADAVKAIVATPSPRGAPRAPGAADRSARLRRAADRQHAVRAGGHMTAASPPPAPPSHSSPNRSRFCFAALKLPSFARHAAEVAQKAEREGWTFGQYLHHLAELEVQERRRRRIERYQKSSELPTEKGLAPSTAPSCRPRCRSNCPLSARGASSSAARICSPSACPAAARRTSSAPSATS